MGSAEEYLVIPTRSERLLDFGYPGTYLKFFYAMLNAATFAHTKRRVHAEAMRVKSRPDPWKWVANQVREFPRCPRWMHAGLIDNIGATCPMSRRRMGEYTFPHYVTPTAAGDMLDLWFLVSLRRIESSRWELAPQPRLRRDGNSSLRVFWPGRPEILTALVAED